VYRDGAAEVKAHFEVKLVRDVKIYKEGCFYAYWHPRKIWDPHLNDAGDLETKDM